MKQVVTSFTVATVVVCGSLALGVAQGNKPDPVLMTISKSGAVLHDPTTTAIYWGSAWNDPDVAGDIITGLDTFFDGFSGSHFAGIASEYYDRNGNITGTSTHLGHVIDTTEPPAGALSASTVIGQACAVTNNSPDPEGVYFVMTSTAAALPGTCAQRFWGQCSRRAPIQVVYIPYMTGLDAGCRGVFDHGDTGVVTGHSVALGQYGNVIANQLMNAITDPRGTGWKDANGNGISFKCDGIFIPAGVYEEFSNGSLWTVRTKWSNAAYLAGTGLPNVHGHRGCVY